MATSEPTEPGPRRRVLVTGCYRSGTTLAEKLLHQHPHATIASQPAPNLWAVIKQRFLADHGLERRYPLGHLFRESGYRPDELAAFLDHVDIDAETLAQIGRQLRDNPDGTWTPDVVDRWSEIAPGGFFAVLDQLLDLCVELLGDARVVGLKEILVEELVDPLGAKGWSTLVVVRDPRDMIASLDFRDRDNLTGDHRPLLFSLRAWRKSVALAVAAAERRPSAHLVRYEDLVDEAADTLAPVLTGLGLDPAAIDPTRPIVAQDGRAWAGNSSFGDHAGVFSTSVGSHRGKLPPSTRAYIETVCRPEMIRLGYEPETAPLDRDQLLAYDEPVEPLHQRFDPDYSRTPSRVDDELRRLAMVAKVLDPATASEWFLDPAAHNWLHAAVA